MARIKNWDKFQHFKDRRPPWIKLYRDILDDMNWHKLSGDSAKGLVMLWLIASENNGELPNDTELAFRLRITETKTKDLLSSISNWLERRDITAISERYQLDSPETEGERETEKETEKTSAPSALDFAFEKFWTEYPKRRSKGDALKAWRALKPTKELTERILRSLQIAKRSSDWVKDGGQFVPYPGTWLRAQGWEDDIRLPNDIPRMSGDDLAKMKAESERRMDAEWERQQRLKQASVA